MIDFRNTLYNLFKAAMAAFKKDLEENPELAKQYNVKVPQGKLMIHNYKHMHG